MSRKPTEAELQKAHELITAMDAADSTEGPCYSYETRRDLFAQALADARDGGIRAAAETGCQRSNGDLCCEFCQENILCLIPGHNAALIPSDTENEQ